MPVDPKQAQTVLRNANSLISWANNQGYLIILVGNEFKKNDWLNIFRNYAAEENSPGSETDERLIQEHGNAYFPKSKSDAFSNTDFEKYLINNKVDNLYIAGMYAEYCVYYTTKAATNRKYQTTVISDALASKNDKDLSKALQIYRKQGIKLATTKELCLEP
jgi:nicotinamidase/pyrazinamidase